ncbi:MAG: hypothetical protein AABW46_00485, partial [Nanoarchaeota archaeon]
YNIDSNFVQILALKIYPNTLLGYDNGTVDINGQFYDRTGVYKSNITENENITGSVKFNASVNAGSTTTNVTWIAIKGSTEVILGSVHEIGNTALTFDTGNGSLPDGYYNLTIHYTNGTIQGDDTVDGNIYNAANSFNTTILNIVIDNTEPTAQITTSDVDDVVYVRSAQKVSCDFDESAGGSGLDLSSRILELEKPDGDKLTFTDDDAATQEFKETNTAATGQYIAKCKVSDGVGYQTTAEKKFRVNARGGVSSATSGSGRGGGTAVEGVEGGEDTGEAAPSEPSESGAPTTGIGGPTPSVSAPGGAGGTVAIVIIVIVIAAGVIYFLVKGKPGKKGQIKFSRSELRARK